jgi:formamidopyrimidine-DNA glycosylase
MTGQFIFEDKQLRAKTRGQYRLLNKANAPLVSLPGKHTHVIFNFPDASTLFFNDVRKFGYLKLVNRHELAQVKELNTFGPEPLDPNFTVLQFISILKRFPQRKIKEVLVDPTVMAGIGNIYSDEILFLAGIRPARQVLSLKDDELKKIHKYIKVVLNKGIQAKGSSVGEYVRTDGSWGEMGKYHWVYGRKGQKCKKCGSIIVSAKFGGRTGSFCPECQR